MITAARSVSEWLPYRRVQCEARVRLFCFAHAGGAASVFRDWQSLLPGEIEVCAVQLPGREARLGETPFTRMDDVASELGTVLAPLLDLPCAFFGYSLGAAIAYETACHLHRRLGVKTARLYVCARRAPHLRSTAGAIHLLTDSAFQQKLRDLGGTPEEALSNTELLELILPILRADFELNDTYTTPVDQRLLECPIHAFGGLQDTEVSQSDLDAWRNSTQGSFKMRMFPEGHFFLKPNLRELLREIGDSVIS